MSTSSFDAIKRKYNFKEISVATWRDPALSVHPARGGPGTPDLFPGSTYKVRLDHLSQPTDDEQSDAEDNEHEPSTEGEWMLM